MKKVGWLPDFTPPAPRELGGFHELAEVKTKGGYTKSVANYISVQ